MKNYRFNFSIWLFISFFVITSALGLVAAVMLFTFSFPISRILSITAGAFVLSVAASHIYSFISLLSRYVVNKKTALTLSPRGIENTFITVIIFAYVFIIPIKIIPWRAVYRYKVKLDSVRIKADPKYLTCSKLLKFYFNFFSFDAANLMISPKVKLSDLEQYKKIKMPKKTNLFF